MKTTVGIIDKDNTKKTKQNRLDELKIKIHYAENALDTYKETNNYLYEVNSFYLNELKQELELFEKSP